MLSEIFIANGANIFIWIVVILIGFGAALGFIDNRKEKQKKVD